MKTTEKKEIENHNERPAGNGRPLKICVIGAGNVATHLARALSEVASVAQIVSRHEDSARRLASRIPGCEPVWNLSALAPDADLYLLAVNDDRVAEVMASTPDFPGIWAHTSGSVPVDVFAGHKSRYGVFYPLQTFTRDLDVTLSDVPFFIEGNDSATADKLFALASKVSQRVEMADSSRRALLHVAAVFACNFANLMWHEADEILRKGGLDVTYLMPLLRMTLSKLEKISPRDAMTGPARRGDREVIGGHIAKLSGRPKEIYQLLSESIIELYEQN